MPAVLQGLPVMLGGPAMLIPTLKAGLALKFFWLTAALVGTGYFLLNSTRPGFKDRAEKEYQKFSTWMGKIGKDDEWDRFFEAEHTV